MRFLHYTAAPFTLDRERKYGPHPHHYKPTGLWLSAEGDMDWLSWCEGEGWGFDNLKFVTEIALRPEANIKRIDSIAAFDAFDREFKIAGANRSHDTRRIDWERVRAAYDGIVIAPYQYRRRLEVMWYYGWDCASGCIWNLNAVERVGASEPVVLTVCE